MKKVKKIVLILLGIILLSSCQAENEMDLVSSNQEQENLVEEVTEESETITTVTEDVSNSQPEKKVVNTNNQTKSQSMVSDYDFSLITVGTGTPKYVESQSNASTLIQYNGSYYLVDCGDGSNANLEGSGLDFKNLEAILFTHHHLDHTTDFFDIYAKRFLSNDSPIDIIGPPRTEKIVEFFNEVYLDDYYIEK